MCAHTYMIQYINYNAIEIQCSTIDYIIQMLVYTSVK